MSGTPTVTVTGIEAVQSIQSCKNDIPLFSGKRTIFRVYFDTQHLEKTFTARGVLQLQHKQHGNIDLVSDSSVLLNRKGQESLEFQRASLDGSLNFSLPEDQVLSGKYTVSLTHLNPSTGGLKNPKVCPNKQHLIFEPALSLRIRVIGFRVKKPDGSGVDIPDTEEFDQYLSWVERVFPCSVVQFSSGFIDAGEGLEPPYSNGSGTFPDYVWQKKHDLACAQLMAHRAVEIEQGIADPRTYYYGIIQSEGEPITGAVSNVPDTGRPDIVGIGPAAHDDGELSSHELGHALGCLHPGYGDGQAAEDANFPRENKGRISNKREKHLGWDFGITPATQKILHYKRTFDFMSYLTPVWISAYHYLKIIAQLKSTEQLTALKSDQKKLHISGVYSTRKSKIKGKLLYVSPVKHKLPAFKLKSKRVKVAVFNQGCKVPLLIPIEAKRPEAKDLHHDSGAFQLTIERDPEFDRIELQIDGKKVHSWPYEKYEPDS